MIDFNIPGEMTSYERKLLYKAVITAKPNLVLEVGTGSGSSSHFILKALQQNNKGLLYTCDPVMRYRPKNITGLKSIFHYHKQQSKVLIDNMIKNNKVPDFIFFDGPEIPEVALEDFKRLNPIVETGTIFMMHDWCIFKRKYDNGVSVKAKLLNPYFHRLGKFNWNIILETNGIHYSKGFETVGMIIAQKL